MAFTSKQQTGPPQLLHFAFQVLFDPYFCNLRVHSRPSSGDTPQLSRRRRVQALAKLRRYSHTPAFALWVSRLTQPRSQLTQLSQHDDHPTAATMGRTAAPRSDERIVPAHAAVACAHALACIHDAAGAARGAQALRAGTLHRRASRRRRDTGVGG